MKVLRIAATKGQPGLGYPDTALFILWLLLLGMAVYLFFVPSALAAWLRTIVFIALPIVTVVAAIALIHKLRQISRIRKHLSSLREKKQ